MTKEDFTKICESIPDTKFVSKEAFLKLVEEDNELSLITPKYNLILLKERLQVDAKIIDSILNLYDEYKEGQ